MQENKVYVMRGRLCQIGIALRTTIRIMININTILERRCSKNPLVYGNSHVNLRNERIVARFFIVNLLWNCANTTRLLACYAHPYSNFFVYDKFLHVCNQIVMYFSLSVSEQNMFNLISFIYKFLSFPILNL